MTTARLKNVPEPSRTTAAGKKAGRAGSGSTSRETADKLVFVTDELPGIRRERRGRGFVYVLPGGRALSPQRDASVLTRIRKLAIPPAYREVWICLNANGHLQATGRDDRGRKQYRYHERWREVRDAHKFDRMLDFGRALPRIRAHVARDLRARGLAREKVLATIVRLLDTTLMRVGNDEYAQANGSYGLTTLRDRHAQIRAGKLHLQFRGKSGVQHRVELHDPRVAEIVRRCQELPGQELFQYLEDAASSDERKKPHPVSSSDVNAYLREISGGDFTAKDFRTWHGTVLALELLAAHRWESHTVESHAVAQAVEHAAENVPTFIPSKTAIKKVTVQAIRQVAERLGNTPAVCRKAYVHPAVLEAFAEGGLLSAGLAAVSPGRVRGLQAMEGQLLHFLRKTKTASPRTKTRLAAVKVPVLQAAGKVKTASNRMHSGTRSGTYGGTRTTQGRAKRDTSERQGA